MNSLILRRYAPAVPKLGTPARTLALASSASVHLESSASVRSAAS